MGEALASHTFHACGCARHFKACFAHKTSDALSYSVTFVSQVPKLGIASWDNCVDFVVSRAIQSTNASPELFRPRGTSCACCPCVHGAYGSDMFEYYIRMFFNLARSIEKYRCAMTESSVDGPSVWSATIPSRFRLCSLVTGTHGPHVCISITT